VGGGENSATVRLCAGGVWCLGRVALARERECGRLALCRARAALAASAARRASAWSSGAIAAMAVWSAPPKASGRGAVSLAVDVEVPTAPGASCPATLSVIRRTAIPATRTAAAAPHRRVVRFDAASERGGLLVASTRRRAPRRRGAAASGDRSAVPLGRRCWIVLEASTAAPGMLSLTRRMSSSIPSPRFGLLPRLSLHAGRSPSSVHARSCAARRHGPCLSRLEPLRCAARRR